MPDKATQPPRPDHSALGSNKTVRPGQTPSGRKTANTSLADDRYADQKEMEEKATDTNLRHAE